MANLLIGESSEELLQFIYVDMDLFSIVGALEKVVNGLFVTLFNVEFIILTGLILISVIPNHEPCHFNMIFIRIIRIYVLIMK